MRILIVDDHGMVREGFRFRITPVLRQDQAKTHLLQTMVQVVVVLVVRCLMIAGHQTIQRELVVGEVE